MWFSWRLLWQYGVSLNCISIVVQLELTMSVWARCYHWDCWRTEVHPCDCATCVSVSLGSVWLPEGSRSSLTWGLSVRTNGHPSWPAELFLEAEQPDLGEAAGGMPVWLLGLAVLCQIYSALQPSMRRCMRGEVFCVLLCWWLTGQGFPKMKGFTAKKKIILVNLYLLDFRDFTGNWLWQNRKGVRLEVKTLTNISVIFLHRVLQSLLKASFYAWKMSFSLLCCRVTSSQKPKH